MTAHDAAEHHPGPGWPFWAPSESQAIEGALTLAEVEAGDRFVDLGCGDGRVLLAAGRRGATVTGVESDPALVSQAREALAAGGIEGTVLQEDIFDHRLDAADVVFTYLSPATLQRLLPRLEAMPRGSRLVTVDFAVPGLVPDGVEGPAHLYRMPPRRRRRRRRTGWPSHGALVVALPEYESLTCVELVHHGGPVRLTVSGDIADVGTFRAGLDHADPGQLVAIDVRWGEEEAGVVADGTLELRGLPRFPVFVLFSDEDDTGLWELSPDACRRLSAAFRKGEIPGTAAELVALARGEA